MARDNESRMRAGIPTLGTPNNAQSAKNIQEVIDRHWEYIMPKEAKSFLLQNKTCDFHKLAKFWSSPSVIEYTRGGISGRAGSICGVSMFLALNYLMLGGKDREARMLTLNGSFIHQCLDTPIETIVEMCGPNFNSPVEDYMVPLFSRGLESIRTRPTMEAFLRDPPKEYRHMIPSYSNISCPDNLMDYVGQIEDDWSGSCPSPKSSKGNEIQLILVDDTNEDERHSFNVRSATTLRSLFHDYAEKRCISLRSLRFSHDGKTLFLSSAGKKTPDELNMRDKDIINVAINTSQETRSSGRSSERNRLNSKKAKTAKKSPRRTKGKSRKKQTYQGERMKTLEEYKAQHSKKISKLHEEVYHQLKEIRMRLNALDLERQPPKKKKMSKKKNNATPNLELQILPNSGIGGKAGKSSFIIQVGDVQNLYKTTKACMSIKNNTHSSSVLDLHGYPREEALKALDESLKVWSDTAMQGSYPFVIPAMIVCGCGNQILSETVDRWIKSKRNVCNIPKNLIPRDMLRHGAQ